ncbi:MAG TPA: glycosyltransferase [Bacilli bacterium]|nr:glycosyltransferase [Bacilli bacterium]
MKLPLSVCMIVRNEAAQIADALRSVLPNAAEVIVVDTGSEDRTREIARELGAQVTEFAWCEDFAAARNFALQQATQPFILTLDADEQLLPESRAALAAYCRSDGRVAGQVKIRDVRPEAGGTEGAVTWSEVTRLFPNEAGYRYVGRIHEQLRCHGAPPDTVSTGVILQHTGYAAETVAHKDKIARNLRLLEQQLADDPYDTYALYQLGRTYSVAKRHAEAADCFQRALDELSERSGEFPPYLPTLLVSYGYALLALREFPTLYQVTGIGTELYPDYTDLYFLYGLALIQAQAVERLAEIPEVFHHCLNLGEPDPARYESVAGVGSFKAHHNLGVYYELIGDAERAASHYQASKQ